VLHSFEGFDMRMGLFKVERATGCEV